MTLEAVQYSPEKAKEYQKKREKLTLINLALAPALLLFVSLSGLTGFFRDSVYGYTQNPHAALAMFFVLYSLFMMLVEFPFSFYSGFIVEKKFSLSNQTFFQWIGDYFKKTSLAFLFSLIMIQALYALIWNQPENWWLWAWAAYSAVSYVLGKIFPVFIVPMFYKYGPVENEEVKRLILKLAERYQMPLSQIYSLNLSKTTKKANAAFMGLGKTKRVVLSDTLLAHFTPEEIEAVVAHELGHCKHQDIWKQLSIGLVTSLIGFRLVFEFLPLAAEKMSFTGAGDIAALPLIFLIFYVFYLVLTPLQNGFSRWVETAADRFAFDACKKPGILRECLEKLGRVNLSDPDPNPVFEWFFYDHPSIGNRVRKIRAWEAAL